MESNRYMMRGVSAAKEDVHNAIKNIDANPEFKKKQNIKNRHL